MYIGTYARWHQDLNVYKECVGLGLDIFRQVTRDLGKKVMSMANTDLFYADNVFATLNLANSALKLDLLGSVRFVVYCYYDEQCAAVTRSHPWSGMNALDK